jgi:hypothetical protein
MSLRSPRRCGFFVTSTLEHLMMGAVTLDLWRHGQKEL